jgi:hypothetical protein
MPNLLITTSSRCAVCLPPGFLALLMRAMLTAGKIFCHENLNHVSNLGYILCGAAICASTRSFNSLAGLRPADLQFDVKSRHFDQSGQIASRAGPG